MTLPKKNKTTARPSHNERHNTAQQCNVGPKSVTNTTVPRALHPYLTYVCPTYRLARCIPLSITTVSRVSLGTQSSTSSVVCTVHTSKGYFPIARVSRVSPRLQTSAEGPYGSPCSRSGDMYTAVPTKEWALPRLARRGGPGSSIFRRGVCAKEMPRSDDGREAAERVTGKQASARRRRTGRMR